MASSPTLPLKGKYDGRKDNAKNLKRRKPLHEIHLSRNTAAKLFRDLNLYDKFLQLLGTSDERLRFEVMRYLWDRLEGKPFVATNPNEVKTPNVMIDARVQNAIQQYVQPRQRLTDGLVISDPSSREAGGPDEK